MHIVLWQKDGHGSATSASAAPDFKYIVYAIVDAKPLDDIFQPRAAVLLAVHLDRDRYACEHGLDLLPRHTLAVVGHGDADALFFLADGEGDALLPLDVPQAVVDCVPVIVQEPLT